MTRNSFQKVISLLDTDVFRIILLASEKEPIISLRQWHLLTMALRNKVKSEATALWVRALVCKNKDPT